MLTKTSAGVNGGKNLSWCPAPRYLGCALQGGRGRGRGRAGMPRRSPLELPEEPGPERGHAAGAHSEDDHLLGLRAELKCEALDDVRL